MLKSDGDVMKWLDSPELDRINSKEAGWMKSTDLAETCVTEAEANASNPNEITFSLLTEFIIL
jgi:hypothetical protein